MVGNPPGRPHARIAHSRQDTVRIQFQANLLHQRNTCVFSVSNLAPSYIGSLAQANHSGPPQLLRAVSFIRRTADETVISNSRPCTRVILARKSFRIAPRTRRSSIARAQVRDVVLASLNFSPGTAPR